MKTVKHAVYNNLESVPCIKARNAGGEAGVQEDGATAGYIIERIFYFGNSLVSTFLLGFTAADS